MTDGAPLHPLQRRFVATVILDLHQPLTAAGANISAASEPGRGTRFQLRFPCGKTSLSLLVTRHSSLVARHSSLARSAAFRPA